MRIAPITHRYNNKTNNSEKHTWFEKKNDLYRNSKVQNHQYSGVASTDLAYASMYDKNIARDLKIMGLI